MQTQIQKVTPFLSFDGRAEEAARFYVSLLPDSRIDRVPVSFQIACADQAEVDRLWAALTDGGTGIACGWLKDRWGVFWQVTPTRLIELINDPDHDRACRAMEAMMKMVKIDIAELERAAAA
jgi:predicted 3-demethylubiquinone-9 3-methyltransferase (glyoxalase superfamily)